MPEPVDATRWGVRAVDAGLRVNINGQPFDFDQDAAADLAQTIRVILGVEKPAPERTPPKVIVDAATLDALINITQHCIDLHAQVQMDTPEAKAQHAWVVEAMRESLAAAHGTLNIEEARRG